MQRDWPVAPYSLLADGGEPERHFWLRADPVHLRLVRDQLVLADSTVFEISRGEAEALVETLNRHFAGELLFYPMHPERWYARPAHWPANLQAHLLPGIAGRIDFETTPLAAARGSGITAHLPTGPAAARFQVLMNEAQMLLHEHPVNLEREARGALPVNSVWFWGGGTIEHRVVNTATHATTPAATPRRRLRRSAPSGWCSPTIRSRAASPARQAPRSGRCRKTRRR